VFFHADHLNSARLTTNENGYPIWQSTYLPFGYEYNPQAKTTDIKFAGYERDAESDLDYAFARSYSFRHARFTSVDPVAGSVIDPQTLNRYSYARNNPLRVVDPTGAWSLGGFLADFGSDFQDGGGGGGGCCDDYGDWGGWGIDGYDGDDPYFYDANGDLVYGTDYTFQVSAAQPDNGECNAFCQAIFSDPIWGNASDFVNDVGMAETYVIGGFFGGELLGSGDLLTLGDLGGDEAAAGTFPDEFFSSKAPWQVEPGVETLEGQYIDDVGNVEPWRAHYDEFGRQIGRTDFNAGDPTQGIPDIHYHTYEYGPGYGPQGAETGSHIPGIFPEP
jgi:RHS repeat-associated protein